MAGRRLAVAVPPTTLRIIPPPPRAPTAPDGRGHSPSLASLLSGDFVIRPRYRCCCRLMHLRTASFLIGVVDTLGMSAAFGRGLHLGLSMQHNPMAIGWFVISSLMFFLSFMCTLAMFYGVWRERYLWIVPKLVMKISAIVLYSATTVALVYMMMEHSQYLLDLVAEHVTKSDYEAARLALRTGGGGLAVAFLLMALAHVWFFYILYRCYKYLKDKYFWRKSRLANSEINENHVAAVLASVSSASPAPLIGASDQSRSQNLSTSDDVNSNTVFSGRNGNVRRSISNECDGRENRAVPALSTTSLSEFELSSTLRSSRMRPDESVPCSCHSPNIPHASSDTLWREFSQTHV